MTYNSSNSRYIMTTVYEKTLWFYFAVSAKKSTFAQNKKRRRNARDKTKPHSTTAAEGTEPYLPEPDAHDARRDGERDKDEDKSRPQHLHRLPEHLPQ